MSLSQSTSSIEIERSPAVRKLRRTMAWLYAQNETLVKLAIPICDGTLSLPCGVNSFSNHESRKAVHNVTMATCKLLALGISVLNQCGRLSRDEYDAVVNCVLINKDNMVDLPHMVGKQRLYYFDGPKILPHLENVRVSKSVQHICEFWRTFESDLRTLSCIFIRDNDLHSMYHNMMYKNALTNFKDRHLYTFTVPVPVVDLKSGDNDGWCVDGVTRQNTHHRWNNELFTL